MCVRERRILGVRERGGGVLGCSAGGEVVRASVSQCSMDCGRVRVGGVRSAVAFFKHFFFRRLSLLLFAAK